MFALTMRGVQQTLVVIFVLAVLAGHDRRGHRRRGRLLRAVGRLRADAVHRRDPRHPAAADRRRRRRSPSAPAACGASRWCSGLFTWTGLARLVRAEFLALREREFVDAARVAGASNRRIIFKHILPNTVGTIVVATTLLMGAGILTEAALGFLGFGIRSPDVSLGSLVSDYQGAFTSRPWLFIWPGVFIVVIVLCLQFIGDGLRDAFDPRQKRIPKRKDLDRSQADEGRARGRRSHAEAGDLSHRCQSRPAARRRPARPARAPAAIVPDVPA